MSENNDRLIALFAKNDIIISEEQAEQFDRYYELLTEYNQKFNLTAITERAEVEVKHFLDSALGARFIPDGSRVVDIGSGAGFPAIPLKIINPTLKITMLDALNKRVGFLETVVKELKLTDAAATHRRAEEEAWADGRQKYDVAIARAVASMATLCEYALPLLKVNGIFVAYKGDNGDSEREECVNALRLLGGEMSRVQKISLNGEYERTFLIVKKTRNTPEKYPRKQNKPKILPL